MKILNNDETQLELGELHSDDTKVELLSTNEQTISFNNNSLENASLELRWKNISYHTHQSFRLPFTKAIEPKALITNLSGRFRGGQLTAILGPSGAGKTTLIECLAGRRAKGLSGSITIAYRGLSKSDVKIAYYSQRDALYERLTAEEALDYAYRLCKCQSRLTLPTKASLLRLKKELNLVSCGKTKVQSLSGGEKRRLSIALELIFSPSILLLDEPTSGLDSLSTVQCISMLKKLITSSPSGNKMVVAVSIHQPTAKLLCYFDQIYIISNNGKCIYNGPPGQLIEKLSSVGLKCPEYHNPSDFIIEIASGEFGYKSIDKLAEMVNSETNEIVEDGTNEIQVEKLVTKSKFFEQTWWQELKSIGILTEQSTLLTLRDPHTYLSRFVIFGATLFLIWLLYHDEPIGIPDGCSSRPSKRWLEVFNSMDFSKQAATFYDNFGFLFYSVVVIVFMAILPVLLSFPLEVSVFIKENFNGWYSLRAYYIARNISELPSTFVFPVVYGSISYYLTGQPMELQRFMLYNFILVITTFLAQGLGFMVAAFFVSDVPQSAIVGGIINVPLFLFTGLLIKIRSMPDWIYPFTFVSYLRLAFESLLVTVYGMGRCEPIVPVKLNYLKTEFGDSIIDMYDCVHDFDDTGLVKNVSSFMDVYNEKFIEDVRANEFSYTLNIFNYSDRTLYENLGAMCIYLVFLRIAGFWILRWQTRIK